MSEEQPEAPQTPAQKKSSKTRWIAAGAVAVVAIAAIVVGGLTLDRSTTTVVSAAQTTLTTEAPTTTTTAAPRLYPNRVDAQPDDKEQNMGGSVMLSGYTTTAKTATFQKKLDDYSTKGYIVVDVNVFNRDKASQPYDSYDWHLQTPNGQIIDPTSMFDDDMGSGALVNGGNVSGQVAFEVGSLKGEYYLIYAPDFWDDARGIWKVTI